MSARRRAGIRRSLCKRLPAAPAGRPPCRTLVAAMTSPAGPTVRAPAPPPTAEVLGVPLARTDYAGTLDWIDATIAAGGRGYICVAAVHTVMLFGEDPDFRAAVRRSSLVVPDGQPLVWALRALGHRLPDRVYGPELMDRACARAAAN